MTNKIYTIEEIQQVVKPIAEKYKIEKVWLFGSYARGEATEKSDIDILISNYQRVVPMALANLLGDFEETFKKPIDIVTQNSITDSTSFQTFARNVNKERMSVYGS